MVWLKLSDDFPDGTIRLSDSAFRTHIEGLCWAMRRETGGHLVRRDLRRFAETESPEEAASELVRLGHWVERSDGWQIVHHMEHQIEPDVIRKRRENDAERQRRYRRSRRPDSRTEVASPLLLTRSLLVLPVPTRPVPTRVTRIVTA